MKLIPAIDIIEGKCVRLTKGDYATKKIYSENPLEIAKQFEGHGIEYLHLVDLDGAKSRHIVNTKTLEQITSQTNLKVDFGGGVKSDQDLQIAFNCGAYKVTAGSVAVKNPELVSEWIQKYGSDKFILGADCKNKKIATHGWMESSTLDIINFIKEYKQKGLKETICTDISKDGMLQGPSISLYEDILSETDTYLIASGGVSSLKDLITLKEIGCYGAIIGKAFYEGALSLKDLQHFNNSL